MIDRLIRIVDPARFRKREFRKLIGARRVFVGEHTYGVPTVHLYRNDHETRLYIGKYCSIAANVNILLGGNHPTDRITTFPLRDKLKLEGAGRDGYPSSKGDIRIGNDVWIGFGVTIVSGVEIGNGAVVAAGSTVVSNVAAYSIVGGNPAKTIRMRFDDAAVDWLTRLEWWNWSESKVADRVSQLCSTDLSEAIAFIRKAEGGDPIGD